MKKTLITIALLVSTTAYADQCTEGLSPTAATAPSPLLVSMCNERYKVLEEFSKEMPKGNVGTVEYRVTEFKPNPRAVADKCFELALYKNPNLVKKDVHIEIARTFPGASYCKATFLQ